MSKIYLRAAELVSVTGFNDDGRRRIGCCSAIYRASFNDRSIPIYERYKPAQAQFTDKFRMNNRTYWYGTFTVRNQLARSLGLLLMHEMVNEV